MKQLPKLPYLQNILQYWAEQIDGDHYRYYADGSYQKWLSTLGFAVPVWGDYLEFPDDFTDEELTMFMLRWS